MPQQVCKNAVLMCSFGVAPSNLGVLPVKKMDNTGSSASANIMDNKPNVNIMPFGMCTSPSNPQVAAATAAAMGVLTPQPCVPMTAIGPWAPGSPTILIKGQPALNNTSKLMCQWGGVISVTMAGQMTHDIP